MQHQEQPGLQLGGVTDDGHDDHVHYNQYDPSAALAAHDAAVEDVVSSGPDGKKIKNLAVVGRGDRLVPDATTDVWAHDGYAYLGTFNEPCGTGVNYEEGVEEVDLVNNVEAPGIAIFNVKNPNKPTYVGNIPSLEGSRINDVKVFTASDGTDLLVHSNEACAGGPGGFDLYDVSDPENPIHLAHVQTDDINGLLREDFGYTDFGVHNLYFFSRDGRDYVGAQVESLLGNFQIFDITDPTQPEFVSGWGAESLLYPNVDWATTTDFGLILAANAYLTDGYGASQNRFLHDFWVSDDGTLAYLANWDAGLVRLDLADLENPEAVSVAIALDSEDGEVNSHSVWPSESGRVVVEGEEDFNPYETIFRITNGPDSGEYPAAEGSITEPIAELDGRTMAGQTVYVGLACDGGSVPEATSAGQIALIQRGVCAFTVKINNANAAGYEGVVVFNDEARGDALVNMGGDPVDLPGVFVGHSTGLAIAGVSSAGDLVIGETGASISVSVEADGWSGFRIWDYSNPENPVLASTFNTVCSANPDANECDARGTYSAHNVIVENQGNKIYAYFSWYTDGLIVVDVTNPYNPVEIARYDESGAAFEAQNGGIQDIWGVYKEENSPFIYGSDRNGGLYIFKMLGKGTIGKK